MPKRHLLIALLASVLAFTPTPVIGQNVRIFLDIADVAGESGVDGFNDKIEVISMGYGGGPILSPDASEPSGSQVVANAQVQMTFIMEMDAKAYPTLFMKCITGAAFTSGFKVTSALQTDTSKHLQVLDVKGRFESVFQEGTTETKSIVSLTVRPTEIQITSRALKPEDNELEPPIVYTWVENP